MVSWFPLPPNHSEPLCLDFALICFQCSASHFWGEQILVDLSSPLREREREEVEEGLSQEGEIPIAQLHLYMLPLFLTIMCVIFHSIVFLWEFFSYV